MYGYLIGLLPFVGVWILLYYLRDDLRREMLSSSAICAPLGALDIYFIPAYWNPPRILGLEPPLESFLFAFLVGGIASVLYEEVFGKKISKMDKNPGWNGEEVLLFGSLSFIFLFSIMNIGVMHVTLLVMAGTAAVVLYHRRDLLAESIFGGGMFLLLYFLILVFIRSLLLPGMFEWWNTEGILEIRLLGIPFGELIWALLFGVVWSPIYEEIRGYRLVE